MPNSNGMKLAVLGLGHVGLPTAVCFADLGWDVIGVEKDPEKAERISRGDSPFYETGVESLLRKHLDSGRFVVETDVARATQKADVLFVCVGTPQREDGAADLSMLEGVARAIAGSLNGFKLIVEKSTTPVQTAQQLKQSVLRYARASQSDEDGQSVEPNFEVAVNPEFLREGLAVRDFFHPDRIVLGVESERAAEMLKDIYRPLFERSGGVLEESIIVTDINTAEIIKHASNAFLATKISFINMVADLCEATGADVTDVAKGLGLDHRIGRAFLQAGIGYGGYCLPKDLRAFNWIASKHGVDFSLLEAVEEINATRKSRFLSKIHQALWVVKDKTVAVWGLAFKPGTDDIRDAPSIGVIEGLLAEGAKLRLFDPQAMGEFRHLYPEKAGSLVYTATAEEAVDGADALLLLTEWKDFLDVDLAVVKRKMVVPLILDGRNLLEPAKVRGLGFEYHSVGRP